MNDPFALKIDVFSHITPPKYREAALKASSEAGRAQEAHYPFRALWDLDTRCRVMDKFPGWVQVLTLSMSLATEDVADKQKKTDLVKMANDEMAELVLKYPDRFPAAVASLPMHDIDAALVELDRSIKDLKCRGIQIFTPIFDKPLDSPEFIPLYEKMSRYNLPIWIHPTRGYSTPDYKTEKMSLYGIASTFGWPWETTTAMVRLVFSGILEKFPSLKFITHHSGGMIPFYWARMAQFQDTMEMALNQKNKQNLTKAPVEYFKMFYADTAIGGNTPGLICAHSFFGADHILFGTDMPYDHTYGDRMARMTIQAINDMEISDTDKKKIYEDNARAALRLPI